VKMTDAQNLWRFTDRGDGNMCETAYGEWVRYDDLELDEGAATGRQLLDQFLSEAARAGVTHLDVRDAIVAGVSTNAETGAPVEMKPCPFCGHSAIAVHPDEYGSGGQHVPPYHAGCDMAKGGCGVYVVGETEADARATWNRRR
jgi:hypothetical protein